MLCRLMAITIYTSYCYRCSVCGEVVTEGLLFRDQRFHPACFTCRTCALPLADKKGEFLLTEAGLQCKRYINEISRNFANSRD